MASFVLGNIDCTFSSVVSAMDTTSIRLKLLDDWGKFARILGTSLVKTKQFKQDLFHDKNRIMDVIEEILVDWRSREGRKATLGLLLKHIEESCKCKEMAESIRTLIKKKAMNWNDLDERSQKDILETSIKFLGRTTNLLEIGKVLGVPKINTILSNSLTKDVLQRMLSDILIPLDSIERKERLPDYIQRTLTLKRQLDYKIFKERCKDVFVLQNTERSQLSYLVHPEMTALSRDQIDNLTVRFIHLESEKDYDIILGKTDHPLHRIKYESGNFLWVSTVGSMRVIQKHLMGKPETIAENEMVTHKLSTHNTRPIAIADCPGMGKTELVFEMARKVAENYPDRYILIVSFPELLSFMKEQTEDLWENLNLSFVTSSLAKYVIANPLGQEILLELMNCKAAKFELFFDAFDEIPTLQIPLSKNILEVFLQSHNLRTFITTRTYMREDLERAIGVISWNIQPFTTTDKTNFFVRFWRRKLDCDNITRVKEFTDNFVKYIQSSDAIYYNFEDDDDFAGIALQCLMLAEVYTADAERYVSGTISEVEITHKIGTLNEMYNRFMNEKFTKVSETERAGVRQGHWGVAMRLLFPDWVDKLRPLLETSQGTCKPVDRKQLLSVGILESIDPPKFVHRTFAEYSLADFVVSTLFENQYKKSEAQFVEFLLETVLASTTLEMNYNEKKLAGYDGENTVYQNPTVVHFIDALCNRKDQHLDFESVAAKLAPLIRDHFRSTSSHIQQATYLFKKFTNCAKNGHTNIFNFLKVISKDLVDYFDLPNFNFAPLVLMAARHDVSFFTTFTQFVESVYRKDLFQVDFGKIKYSAGVEFTPLHAAASLGNYQVVEYLISKYGKSVISKSRYIIYRCVHGTSKESPAVVAQKLEIVRLLVEKCTENIIDQSFSYYYLGMPENSKAVTARGINVKLFKRLIKLKATLDKNYDHEQFLRNVLETTPHKDLNELINFLADENLLHFLFRKEKSSYVIALDVRVFMNNVRPETLRNVLTYNEKIIEYFNDKSELLSSIVRSKWQPDMVKVFVEIYANVDFYDQYKCTLLIHAAREKSLKNIKYLVKEKANVNHVSADGCSPLRAASDKSSSSTFYTDPSVITDCVNILREAGARHYYYYFYAPIARIKQCFTKSEDN